MQTLSFNHQSNRNSLVSKPRKSRIQQKKPKQHKVYVYLFVPANCCILNLDGKRINSILQFLIQTRL